MAYDKFEHRHIGPNEQDLDEMLSSIGVRSLDELIEKTVPPTIRLEKELDLEAGLTERDYFKKIRRIANKNKVFNTYIGMGWYDTITPAVILRNILENPVWYTSYTPYQAEISQGRLEALLNFQTMVCELTGMELSNSSLLDEATAAAEAMIMMFNSRTRKQAKAGVNSCFADENMFPQTIDVLKDRAATLGIKLIVGDFREVEPTDSWFGALVQYPNTNGEVENYRTFTDKIHDVGANIAVAADLLSLAILTPPGEWGADITFGTSQRFGVPMGYGGPSAAYFATKESMKRTVPGRIIGVSVDANGDRALRMALQTREQHIKREKATSNICTAQALLATMAGMYGVYHGPAGITAIAERVHAIAQLLADQISDLGYTMVNERFFDTLKIDIPNYVDIKDIEALSLELEMNFRYFDNGAVGISIDETTNLEDINWIIEVFSKAIHKEQIIITEVPTTSHISGVHKRESKFMSQEVFNKYRSETEMARYIKRLEKKDISLVQSMISLGSCTMKLNAATEMLPLSWIEFNGLHPFIPKTQAIGYQELIKELQDDLSEITGFAATSLMPNSGAAGEYSGLHVISAYHKSRGDYDRDVAIIPSSAHGTNPASAVMAGMKVVVTPCDEYGNIDIEALKAKVEEYKDRLAAFMVTYPSTHGVFEASIIELCEIIHANGGQVYMDGANMNAQVGLTNPANIGADVCHLNLHKTFAIPHGGGGPGVGPICVAEHLVEFLPSHSIMKNGHRGKHAVSSAPWGSASVLPITYGYIKMLGTDGLRKATEYAILNANYIASKLKDKYGVLYTGENGFVAHEMILECRHFKKFGITETDIAKRLIDYGFHAPTLSFPVAGTLMIEPTESESKQELDRFIEAMNSIHSEILEVAEGVVDKDDNVLKNAPHTDLEVTSDEWNHSYSRAKAAYPVEYLRGNKYWAPVARVDNAFGDRNLVCTCEPIDSYI